MMMDPERWDAWLERLILGLVGLALATGVLAFGGVRLHEFVVVEALVALAAVVWVLRIWLIRDHRLLWPPIGWGVLVFAGWAVWRTTEADVQYVAWGELMRILTYTTLFFVVVNNLHRQNTAQGLAWGLVGLATLLCFYGAWQFVSTGNTVWGLGRDDGYVHRASGSYANPNHFAGLLELLVPLALSAVIAGRMKPLTRILLGYCALVLLAGIALTFSRGGWVAAAAGISFVLIQLARHRDYRWIAVGSLALILIGGGVIASRSDVMRRRVADSQAFSQQTRNSRPHIWRAAVGMWRDHPWLGVGPAHFNERFKQYRTHWAQGDPERAHNDYLDALADWGLVGAALVSIPWLLLAYGVQRTLRQVRRNPGDLEVKRSGRYAFVLGTTGGLIALLTHSFADFNLHIPGNALVAITWMALLTGYARYATDDWWVSSKRPWRLPISLVMLALVAALAWDVNHRGRESYRLRQADLEASGSDARLKALESAWALEPRNAWTAFHVGEVYRLRAFTGAPGASELALQGLEWFQRAAALNRFEPAFPIRAGMCLDWVGRHADAETHFLTAHKLDPDGRIASFYVGWHELQKGNEDQAREWFHKSVRQGWPPYSLAENYLRILDRRQREQAGTLPSAVPVPAPAPAGTPTNNTTAKTNAPPVAAPVKG